MRRISRHYRSAEGRSLATSRVRPARPARSPRFKGRVLKVALRAYAFMVRPRGGDSRIWSRCWIGKVLNRCSPSSC